MMTSTPSRPIRVALVEDHELIRVALRALLNKTGCIQVIAETPSAAVALRDMPEWKPDVALMDIYLNDGSGLEVSRKISTACPSTRVLFFSAFCDETILLAAVGGGGAGYLQKTAPVNQLIDAIKSVAQGDSYFDSPTMNTMVQLLRSIPSPAEPEPANPLSPQEDRVIDLMTEGKTNKEIAVLMGLSDKTVKNYASNAFDKLQVSRRAEAVAVYLRNPASMIHERIR
jgi:two-component system, NarL family, response regulator DevR